MVHLRIVAPAPMVERVLELLRPNDCVINIIHLPGAAVKPAGDVVLCDLAKEEASVVIGDLKHLGVPHEGSIAIEIVDSEISDLAVAAEKAAKGLPTDAVVWEEVEARTSESTELSASFLIFMCLSMLLSAVAIMLDSPILMVGAMVVGPEFGPLAGLCVAIVERRGPLARRSAMALLVGFPVAMLVTVAFVLATMALGLSDDAGGAHPFTEFISEPNWYSVIVALLAGTAGVLSLTMAKSGALVGVLISVTTIPAAANVAVAGAIGNWAEAGGAVTQLGVNLTSIMVAGVSTLFIQRRAYVRRRNRHRAAHPVEEGGA